MHRIVLAANSPKLGEMFERQSSSNSVSINVDVSSQGIKLLMMPYGPEQKKETHNRKNSHLIIHFPTSLGVSERASERVSTVERVSEASSVEPVSEQCE